ncbi:MFS transporter [Bacillus benzoevorans]|uniref:MFS family permease n=1 Tax=Bacillus benzoevorans TaxID=1456 RepID=A0A7X0HUF2_9BACI|nr:MFS transporter [Bacillus benzoevorans]MBB6447094.1 MFS family permease [Bacillus benzoevorans]
MQTRLWTKDFILVCATNLFLFLNYYYLLVTLPIYLIQEMNGPKSQVGLVITVFFISAILIRPFAGQWIMSYGIKKIFFIALAIYLASSFMYFFTTTLSSLLILRLIHGVGFGMVTTTAGTIVANLIPDSRKGEGMGYFGLTMNISMALGPFLGLIAMYNWGATIMFAVSAASVMIGTITGLLISLPKKDIKVERPVKKGIDLHSVFEISALKISIVALFFGFIYSSIVSFVSVYAEEIHLSHVASYFFIVYAVVLILSRPFTGRWFDQYGANFIIYPAILLFAAGLYLLSSAASAFIFLLAAAFVGLGWGTIFPSAQTIAIQVARPERRGVATATFLSLFDTGIGIGSLIIGYVGAGIGYSSLYFYCSIFTILGIGVYYLLHGRISQEVKNFSKEKTV